MNKNAIGLHKFSQFFSGDDARSSTRSVQIATCKMYCMLPAGRLCLHTPRADCNEERRNAMKYLHLCLHTLRADCNGLSIVRMKLKCTFASTRSVQIATVKSIGNRLHTIFASTRSVQIATRAHNLQYGFIQLCLHTLRADCNGDFIHLHAACCALPPHAPCRLQRTRRLRYWSGTSCFASTRSVQIATAEMHRIAICTFQNVC